MARARLAKPSTSNRRFSALFFSDRNRKTPAKARMPIGRLMKNTQRQSRLSVSQPPRAGPRIGPSTAPAPQMAMAEPCFSGGLMSSSTAWDSGIRAAPNKPCSRRNSTISTRLPAIAAQHRGGGEAGDRHQEHHLAADAVGQEAGQRGHDRGGDDVGGQHPGDLLGRGRDAALDVRQGDVGDRRVQRVHDRRQHDGDRDRDPVGRVALAVAGAGHRALVLGGVLGRADVDLGLGAEAGAEVRRALVEGQADGQALDDLDPVAGGVLGRQQGEAGAGAGAEADDVGLQDWRS
jgi:hypothetical protein